MDCIGRLSSREKLVESRFPFLEYFVVFLWLFIGYAHLINQAESLDLTLKISTRSAVTDVDVLKRAGFIFISYTDDPPTPPDTSIPFHSPTICNS